MTKAIGLQPISLFLCGLYWSRRCYRIDRSRDPPLLLPPLLWESGERCSLVLSVETKREGPKKGQANDIITHVNDQTSKESVCKGQMVKSVLIVVTGTHCKKKGHKLSNQEFSKIEEEPKRPTLLF